MTDEPLTCPHPEKYRHATRNAVLKALTSLEEARGVTLNMEPYLCACGAWHLGHPSGSLSEKLRAAGIENHGRKRSEPKALEDRRLRHRR